MAPFLIPSIKTVSLPLPPIHSAKDYHLLPNLNLHLFNSWFDHVSTSHQTTKRDDAVIDNRVWDKRITLVFPSLLPHHLTAFRQWSMRYLYRQLYLEFKLYLLKTYPGLWEDYLQYRNSLKREYNKGGVMSIKHQGGDVNVEQKGSRKRKLTQLPWAEKIT